jgi:hypothetical protein
MPVGTESPEQLVRYYLAGNTALERAQLQMPDETATAEANTDLAGTAAKFELGADEELIAAAVRGDALIGVIQHADGRTRKAVVGNSPAYQAPELSPADLADEAYARADLAAMRDIDAAQAAAAQAVADAQTQANTQISQQAVAAAEAATQKVRDTVGAVQPQQESQPPPQEEPPPEPGPPAQRAARR